MNGPAKPVDLPPKTGAPKAERLAAALRENLKRRKAQARAKERVGPVPDKESG
jgi:hypothetical protein